MNSDLVGKVVNLASRTARFVQDEGFSPRRVFEMAARDVDAVSSHQLVSLIPAYAEAADLFKENGAAGDELARLYEAGDFGAVVRRVMQMADAANRFIDAHPPWDKTITPGLQQDFCTIALNFFRQITVYLAPILPRLAAQTGQLLNLPPVAEWNWDDARQPLPQGGQVNKFEHMLQRVDAKKVQAMIEASTEPAPGDAGVPAATGGSTTDGPEALAAEPLAPTCTFDEFAKVDMRDRTRRSGRRCQRVEQAAAADAGPGWRRETERLRRDQRSVSARRPGGAAGHLLCEPRATQNEVRDQ